MNRSVPAAARPYAETPAGSAAVRRRSVVADVMHDVVMDDVVVDDLVVDDLVVDHVVMRVAAARKRQERRHQGHTRQGRHAEPLNLHVFPSDI
jgi:hypothetical protein